MPDNIQVSVWQKKIICRLTRHIVFLDSRSASIIITQKTLRAFPTNNNTNIIINMIGIFSIFLKMGTIIIYLRIVSEVH
jgi:hypothetical protein